MNPLDLMIREIHDAETVYQPVEQIRVTAAAVPGSPVTVVTPWAHDDGDIEVRELLIHPEDWRDLLVERRDDVYAVSAVSTIPAGGGIAVRSVLGLPIVAG